MAVTVAWNALVERLAQELWGSRAIIPVASLNATSSATSLVVDQGPASGNYDLTYSSASVNHYDGVGVYMTPANTTITAPEGEYAGKVTRGGFTGSSATLALSPGFSADPNISPTTAPKIVFFFGLTPFDFLDAANNIIRTLYLPRWLPVTLVTDGDMEASGVGDWTAVAAGGTGAKTTAAANTLLQRALPVTGTSAGDGRRSTAFNVFEGETLNINVAMRVDTGTATVGLYDSDAAAAISGTTYTTDEEGFHLVEFQYTVGANVERIAVQILQSGATALSAFIGYIAVTSQRRRTYDLPSTINDVNDIEEIQYLREGSQFENDSSMLWENVLVPWPQYGSIRDFYGANPQRIELAMPTEGTLFYKFRDNGTVFTGINAVTTETTVVPEEILVEGCLADLKKQLRDQLRNPRRQRELDAQMEEHRRNYRQLLGAIDLGRPRVQMEPPRRVMVP